jgi:hypothetical protein
VFRTRDPTRQGSTIWRLSGDDSNDFWSNLDERHRQHKQHVTWLVTAIVLISIPGILVHDAFFIFALILFIPLTVELLMLRQTRSRVKIPDFREPDTVEVHLEVEPERTSDE